MSINRATPIDDLELYEYLTQLGFYGNQVSKWQLIVARHFRDTVGSPLVNDIVTLPDDECLSIYNYGVKSHQITEHLRNLPELPVVEEPAWPASINDLASLMKQFVVTVELFQEIASQVRNVLEMHNRKLDLLFSKLAEQEEWMRDFRETESPVR